MQTLARLMCRFMRELALLAWLALLALRPCSVRTYILILMLSLTRFASPIPPPTAVWVMTTRCASEQIRNCHIYLTYKLPFRPMPPSLYYSLILACIMHRFSMYYVKIFVCIMCRGLPVLCELQSKRARCASPGSLRSLWVRTWVARDLKYQVTPH